MKTYIDLLPEGKRKEIQRGKNMRTIISQEIGLSFPVFALVLILLVLNFSLKIQLEVIEKGNQNGQSQEKNKELSFYEEKFRNANANLSVISKIQESHLEWSEALVKITQLFPEGVYLNGIATNEYRIFIIGKAQKRDSLIDFQEAVKNSDCFTSLNAPLSNLVSKENIDFQIDFEIKKECLKDK